MREIGALELAKIESTEERYTYNIYITNERELEQACEWLDHKKAVWGFTRKKVLPDYPHFKPRFFNYVLTVNVSPEESLVSYSDGILSTLDILRDWGFYRIVGYIKAGELNNYCGVSVRRGEQFYEEDF